MRYALIALLLVPLGAVAQDRSRLLHDDYGNAYIRSPTGSQGTDFHIEQESRASQPYYLVPYHPANQGNDYPWYGGQVDRLRYYDEHVPYAVPDYRLKGWRP